MLVDRRTSEQQVDGNLGNSSSSVSWETKQYGRQDEDGSKYVTTTYLDCNMRINPGTTNANEDCPSDVIMEDGPYMEHKEGEVREVAVKVVEEVINKAQVVAIDRAGEQSTSHRFLPSVPTIQIDEVGSRTPTPVDSLTDETTGDTILETSQVKSEDEIQELQLESPAESEGLKDNEQLREFAYLYLQDIFARALPLAEERGRTKIEELKIEEGEQPAKKVPSPWYIRLRESLMRFLRLACICGGRRNNS